MGLLIPSPCMVVWRLLSEQSHANVFVGKVLSTSLPPYFHHGVLWWGTSYDLWSSCLILCACPTYWLWLAIVTYGWRELFAHHHQTKSFCCCCNWSANRQQEWRKTLLTWLHLNCIPELCSFFSQEPFPWCKTLSFISCGNPHLMAPLSMVDVMTTVLSKFWLKPKY